MRTKRLLTLLRLTILLQVATHAAMGVATGLAFAFILTHFGELGVVRLISASVAPDDMMKTIMITCVTTFGIGATVTGIAFMTMKDGD